MQRRLTVRLPLPIAALSLALIAGCAPPECRGELVEVVQPVPPQRLDLFVAVDTHDLTDEARRAAAVRLAALVRVIVTGDPDRDGVVDFQPVHDAEVTVLAAEPGCGSPAMLPWRLVASTPGDGDAFASSVAAALEALPSCARSVPIRTLAASVGGLRAHTIPGLLIITDEDEPDAPPRALVDALGAPALRTWLSMIAGFDPSVGRGAWDRRESPGCTASPFDASGAPGLVDAADVLWDQGVEVAAVSICATDWVSSLDAWTEHLADTWYVHCVPRPPPRERITCTVTEQLDPGGYHDRCAGLPGRDPEPLAIVDGFETCRVLRAEDSTLPGWYAGESWWFGGDGRSCGADETTIRWTVDPEPGSTIEVRCVSVGSGCGP